MDINGSVALVTGANRGIGRAIAAELLQRGAAKVYAAVRDPDSITDPRLVALRLDITDPGSVAAAARAAADVDLLVNNAGIGGVSTPLEATLENARAELETNYLGVVSMTQAFAPVLASNGGGTIVNLLSIVSWVAMPHLTTYSASKAAVWSYSNASRVQLAAQGTQVVGVHVGYVETDLTDGLEGEKVAPEQVAIAALDAVAADAPEALVDEGSVNAKAALSDDQHLIYPAIRERFAAATTTA